MPGPPWVPTTVPISSCMMGGSLERSSGFGRVRMSKNHGNGRVGTMLLQLLHEPVQRTVASTANARLNQLAIREPQQRLDMQCRTDRTAYYA